MRRRHPAPEIGGLLRVVSRLCGVVDTDIVGLGFEFLTEGKRADLHHRVHDVDAAQPGDNCPDDAAEDHVAGLRFDMAHRVVGQFVSYNQGQLVIGVGETHQACCNDNPAAVGERVDLVIVAQDGRVAAGHSGRQRKRDETAVAAHHEIERLAFAFCNLLGHLRPARTAGVDDFAVYRNDFVPDGKFRLLGRAPLEDRNHRDLRGDAVQFGISGLVFAGRASEIHGHESDSRRLLLAQVGVGGADRKIDLAEAVLHFHPFLDDYFALFPGFGFGRAAGNCRDARLRRTGGDGESEESEKDNLLHIFVLVWFT